MGKILLKLFGQAGAGVANKISDIIDRHTFSKVERLKFKKK